MTSKSRETYADHLSTCVVWGFVPVHPPPARWHRLTPGRTADYHGRHQRISPLPRSSHKDHGLSYVIIRSVFAQAGITVKEKFLPNARLVSEMRAGKLLAILGNKNYFTPQDLESMEVVPYQTLRFVIYYPKGREAAFVDKPLTSLAGKRAIVIRASVTKKIFEEAGIKVIEVESIEQQFRMMAADRADMMGILDLAALDFLHSEKGKEFANKVAFTQKALKTVSGSIIFNRKNQESLELANIFRRELAVYRTKDTFQKDLKKYYGAGELPVELLDYVTLDQ